jgi:hypothetical protein
MRYFRLLVGAVLGLAACSKDTKDPTNPGGGGDGGVVTVDVTPANPSVPVGGTMTLSAVAKDASGQPVDGTTFSWSSAAPGVASVNEATGVVAGVAAGTATISATGGGKTGSTTVTVTSVAVTTSTAIAYVRGSEIRLVELDGSNDRVIWATPRPELHYTVSGLAWRPNGTEIAFSSNHEQAVSFNDRDIYAVRPDGSGLRKITNGPTHDRLASYPQGTVTVTVTNLSGDAGPYILYVLGAQEPQSALIAPGDSKTLTFPNVADFGDGVQPAVAIFGAFRWFGAAGADVRAGATADAGTLSITSSGGIENLGAVGPGWRSDGTKLAFLDSPACILEQVPADPPPGFSFDPLLDPNLFTPCAFDWAPAAVGVDQLLVALTDFDAGEGGIFRVAEGSTSKGQPLVTYPDYEQLTDLRWLPDGSGFLFAKRTDLFDESVNLFEHVIASGETRQVTTFAGENVRAFGISPDGQSVVFERAPALDGPADIGVMRRDGSDARLLVHDGTSPAWNPSPR